MAILFLELFSCSCYNNIPSNSAENKIYNCDHILSQSFFSKYVEPCDFSELKNSLIYAGFLD